MIAQRMTYHMSVSGLITSGTGAWRPASYGEAIDNDALSISHTMTEHRVGTGLHWLKTCNVMVIMEGMNVPSICEASPSRTSLEADVSKTRRVLGALTSLCELELAHTHTHVGVGEDIGIAVSDIDSRRATLEEGSSRIRDALSVIVTSAFLIDHYAEQLPTRHADITRHLDRIRASADHAETELRRLLATVRRSRSSITSERGSRAP